MKHRYDSMDEKYKIISRIDNIISFIFYFNIVTSFILLIYNSDIIIILSIVTIAIYFIVNNYNKYAVIPEVERERTKHLISKSFNIQLNNEKTNKYYNNSLEPSIIKLGANILENAFFSKNVIGKMLIYERIKVLIYIIIFILLVSLRSTSMPLILFLMQTLFATEMFSRWLNLEFLLRENKNIYSDLYNTFLYKADENDTTKTNIIYNLTRYESAKAYSGIRQSSKIFHSINDQKTKEWNEIKKNLKIK